MGRYNTLNNNFIYGEVSPKMLGRSDLKEYNNMCQQILNATVLKQGGATRRSGSQYVLKQVNNNVSNIAFDANTRCIPMVFSNDEKYILIFCNKSLNFNGSGGPAQLGLVIYNVNSGQISNIFITSAPPFTPTTGQIQDNRFIQIAAGAFYNNCFTGYTTLAQMRQTNFAQSGDILSFVNPIHCPTFISRVGTDAFVLSDIFTMRQAYTSLRNPYAGNDVNVTSLLSPSAVPSSTDTWSCLPYATPFSYPSQTASLTSNNVGSKNTITFASPSSVQFPDGTLLRIDGGGTSGFGYLTDSGANLFLLRSVAATSTAYSFQVASWNTLYGWPSTCIFYQQRLDYASNLQFPDTVWGSQQGDFILMMSVRTLDDANLTVVSNDRPFAFTIAQNKVSKIQWLQADIDLYLGTQSDEWIALGSDGSTSLGPLNITFAKQTSYGSEPIPAISSDGAVQFVQRGGQGLREIVYVFQQNHRLANPLSDWSEHLLRKGLNLRASYTAPKIVEMAYQALDNNITWCIDSNGCLFALTRDRASGLMAWHQHTLGGVDNVNGAYSEIPTVLSICVAPSPNGDSDEVWMVVQRYINGAEVVYIEKMGKSYRFNSMANSSTDIQDKIVLSDCAVLQRLGSAGNTFNGFTHLKNQVVDCLADGNWLGQLTVSSLGVITLPGPTTYTELIAGLPYESLIQGMPEVGGAMQGTGDSTIKRNDRLKMRFERTVAANFGKTNDATLIPIPFRGSTVPNGTPTPMFTGVQDLMFGGTYENDADWMVTTNACLPFTLTSVAVRGLTYEG